MFFILLVAFVYYSFDLFVSFTNIRLLCKRGLEVFFTMEEVLILQKQLKNPEKTLKMEKKQNFICAVFAFNITSEINNGEV